jgi:hypothetical protein
MIIPFIFPILIPILPICCCCILCCILISWLLARGCVENKETFISKNKKNNES